MDNQQPQGAPGASHPDFLSQMENFFDTYLHKKIGFQLPPNAKEWIVKYSPWFTLIAMIIAVPLVLMAIGIGAWADHYSAMYGGYAVYHYSSSYKLYGLISLVAFAFQAAAVQGLFARSLKAWHLVYYSILIHGIGQLIFGDVIGAIVSVAISMYFMFQIREYYK